MTITAQTAKSGPYSGNDSTTVFAYAFKALAEGDLTVTLTVTATGVETVQTITTHYTVSGVGVDGGGNVTMVTAPATGETLTITRDVAQSQGTDLVNRGAVQPTVLETMADRLTQIAQDLAEVQARALKIPVSSATEVNPTTAAPAANTAMVWNATADALVEGPTANEISGAAASATAAAASATAAAADAVLTAADLVLTNADVVLTNADVVSTNADVVSTNADAATTAQDAIDTAADLVQTNLDQISADADATATAADAVSTAADAATTAQDAIDTAADAVLTAADVVSSAASATAAAASAASVPSLDATSGVIETDGTYVAVCKFGPALDGVNWDEKTSAPTAKVMLATIKDAGADTTVEIWSGTVTPIAGSAALASVTLAGAATPTSIAGAGGILIIGCEDGVRFVGIVNNAWAELTTGWPRALSTTTTPALTSNDITAVGAGVWPSWPVDPRTGGTMPCFGVAYGTGADVASVIKYDGNVWDMLSGTVSAGEGAVAFSRGHLLFLRNGALQMGALIETLTADDADAAIMLTPTGTPQGYGAGNGASFTDKKGASADPDGLSLALVGSIPNTGSFTESLTAIVTRTINSGYMTYLTKGAWLANSKTADRSYKANTLTENGTVTEAAVATGAELMGYSGFSDSTNYLSRAFDADLEFGTANFSAIIWFKRTATSGVQYLWARKSTASGGSNIFCSLADGAHTLRMFIGDGSNSTDNSGIPYTGSVWNQLVVVWNGTLGTNSVYINGVLRNTTTNASVGTLTNSNATLAVGATDNGTSALDQGSVSLFRLSTTAPTATQVRQMYDAEKPMFVASAKCLLQSATTDAVLDVDIDAITGFVTVVQTDDEAVWKGLAIHSEPTIPTGGTTWEHSVRHAGAAFTITDANFAGNVPAISLRDVASDAQSLMGNLPAGVDLSKAKAWLNFNMNGSGTIYSSYNIKSMTDNGVGIWTVNFAVPFKSLRGPVAVASGEAVSAYDESIFIQSSGSDGSKVQIYWYNDAATGKDTQNLMAVFFGELENE